MFCAGAWNIPISNAQWSPKPAIYGATVVLIEDQASGTQLIQELVRDGLHSVRKYTPEHDKVMRLHAQTGNYRERLRPPAARRRPGWPTTFMS